MKRVLVVDNYDSFTMNLVQPLRAWGLEVRVERNDAVGVAQALDWEPERIVLSPGPGRPEQAGICVELVRAAGRAGIPLLGVCLGHQCLGHAYEATVAEAVEPLHGEARAIRHDGAGIFAGLPESLSAARYHSLTIHEPLPAALVATAWTEAGALMGVRHRDLPLEGVQFHPESYLTPLGDRLLGNFVGAGPLASLPRES